MTRAHVRTGCSAAKQRTDQDVPQATIADISLVRVNPVPDAGGVVHAERLLPDGLVADDAASSEGAAAGYRVVGDICTGNRRGDSGIGQRADGREESTAFELPECDTFDIAHLGLAATLDFSDHHRLSLGERTVGIDVTVVIEPGVDVVGDTDRMLHIGLFRGYLPRNSPVVVRAAEVVAGRAAGRKGQGATDADDGEGHPPPDVGLGGHGDSSR